MIYIHIPWDFWYSTPSCSLLCLLLPPLLHEYNKIKNSTSLEHSNLFPPALRFCLDCFGISSVRRLRIWYLKTGCLRRCLHPIYGMVSTRNKDPKTPYLRLKNESTCFISVFLKATMHPTMIIRYSTIFSASPITKPPPLRDNFPVILRSDKIDQW